MFLETCGGLLYRTFPEFGKRYAELDLAAPEVQTGKRTGEDHWGKMKFPVPLGVP